MIRGSVMPSREDNSGLEAWVEIAIAGDERTFQLLEAVVDTGYTGWLMLPEAAVQRLNLHPSETRYGVLADGRTRENRFLPSGSPVAWLSSGDLG